MGGGEAMREGTKERGGKKRMGGGGGGLEYR